MDEKQKQLHIGVEELIAAIALITGVLLFIAFQITVILPAVHTLLGI